MSTRVPPRLACLLLALLLPRVGEAQATSTLSGTVRSAETREPVADVVVTATSPSLPGEQTVVTDAQGHYRMAGLPLGTYTLRFEKEGFAPYGQQDLVLRRGYQLRVSVSLALWNEEFFILRCGSTIVDVGSTATVVSPEPSQALRLAVGWPREDRPARPANSILAWIPGPAAFGGGFSTVYLVDDLATGDAASGFDALPVSQELIQYMEVQTAGYPAEYGRATGGIVRVVTRGGSNEFHGSVFAHWTPGLLEGRQEPVGSGRPGSALRNAGDFGATLGGPILRDRLWFFVGAVPSLGRVKHTEFLADAPRASFTDQRGLQALGKLTYLINSDHSVSLSVLTTPGSLRAAGAGVEPWELDSHATRVSLHHAGAFLDKRLLLDTRLGWLTWGVSQHGTSGVARQALLGQPEGPAERYQGAARLMGWLNGLGSHVFAAGVDTELLRYERMPGTSSLLLGAYVQDSWSFDSRVTVNGGLRYDVQRIETGAPGQQPKLLPALSPRLGVAVDPWANGRTRLFVHLGRNVGRVPRGPAEDVPSGLDAGVPSSRELLVGVERELPGWSRVGATYARRALDLAAQERTSESLTLMASHDLIDGWLGHLSYTGTRLRGPPLAPEASASGSPFWSRPHVIRAYGARELHPAEALTLTSGLAYLGGSGTRLEGSLERSPWVHSLDVQLGVDWRLGRDETVSFSLDAFNLFNFQAATRLEARDAGLVPVRYQPPRQLRLGVRYRF